MGRSSPTSVSAPKCQSALVRDMPMTAVNHVAVTSATIANGSKTLSIVGNMTPWLVAGYKFGNAEGTCWQVIDSIGAYSGGNTPVTLAENWGGAGLTAAAGQIEITTEGASLSGKVVSILNLLGNGMLSAIASLAPSEGDTLKFVSGTWTAAPSGGGNARTVTATVGSKTTGPTDGIIFLDGSDGPFTQTHPKSLTNMVTYYLVVAADGGISVEDDATPTPNSFTLNNAGTAGAVVVGGETRMHAIVSA